MQHNAFRATRAPSIETLRNQIRKVDYLRDIYENMHKRIVAHPEYLHEENIQNVVLAADFVFISMDKGGIKRELINKLLENNKPFIDVGIGIFGLIANKAIKILREDIRNEEISSRVTSYPLNSKGFKIGYISKKKRNCHTKVNGLGSR